MSKRFHMYEPACLFLMAMLLAACGPSVEEVAAMTAAAWTETPTATATATLTGTPTSTSTATPTLTPTPMGGGRLLVNMSNPAPRQQWLYLLDAEGSNPVLLAEVPEGYSASLSPDITRLALIFDEGDNNLYLMHADGSDLTMLVDLPNSIRSPGWSPDGTQITFYSGPEGERPALYLVKIDGGDPIRVADQVSGFTWSPDGSRLACHTNVFFDEWGGLGDLYVAKSDGREAALVSHKVKSSDWSPDGARLAFITVPATGTLGLFDLYVANPDGGKSTLRASDISEYRWSPDSSQILVRTETGPQGWQYTTLLQTIQADRTGLTTLAEMETQVRGTEWSPDGSHIALIVQEACMNCWNSNICVMNADGSNLICTSEPPGPGFSQLLTWSPDGERIAYTTQEGGYTVEVVDANSGSAIRLVESDRADEYMGGLYWSPDGTYVAGLIFNLSGRQRIGQKLFVARADGSKLSWLNELLHKDTPFSEILEWQP